MHKNEKTVARPFGLQFVEEVAPETLSAVSGGKQPDVVTLALSYKAAGKGGKVLTDSV